MLVFEGKPVYGGVAKGKIHICAKSENRVRKITIEDCENEIKRFHEALSLASGDSACKCIRKSMYYASDDYGFMGNNGNKENT